MGGMDSRRGFRDDDVPSRPAVGEREIEALQFELDPDYLGREHAQRLLEQFLPGLVAF